MPFCNQWDSNLAGEAMFCSECGNKLTEMSAESPVADPIMRDNPKEEIVWSGAPMRFGLPSSTSYTLTNQRLIVKAGFIGKREGEIELLSVTDIKVTQTLTEQALSMGSITVCAADATGAMLMLENVEDPFNVKEIIASAVKQARSQLGVFGDS